MMYLALPLTVITFLCLRALHLRVNSPFLNPVLWTILISACVLVTFNLDVQHYTQSTFAFNYLLELAVVALAIPLYKQIHQLKRQLMLLCIAVSAGIVCATTTALVIATLLGAPEQLTASLATLAVTTPITLLVTEQLGGIASIAASMVILIGVVGAVLGFSFLRAVRITNKAAQGTALGGACHAIGTATAIADNELSAAYASTAMALSALLTPIITPLYFSWLMSIVERVVA
ncbi:LrgB family protein [Pseudoalteromonas sp. SSDWG2]|uniref:LrgB family protein n=1 Tax=Pseudoalteromonas sp. SSDWG2 TaxID=3139391 RepID=UPI003BA86C31